VARVMLLIPSASYRAPDFLAAAAKLDVEVVVGSDRRGPLEDLQPAGQVELDFADADAGVDQIEAFARRYPIDAIVSVDDAGIRLAARASRRLELPHNPVAAVEATRDKSLLRRRLAEAGLDSPAFRLLGAGDDRRAVARQVDYPVVLKPLSFSGSRGVIRADDAEAFVGACARLGAILADPACAAEAGDLGGFILIEGYVPGVEVSLEGLLDGGRLRVLAIFDKPDPLEGPYFEETIYVTPSRLAAEDQRRVAEAAERAAAALGLRDGPLHAELRLNPAGVFPIDIAARSIGGLCSRTLSFGTGISLEELILRHAIGGAVEPPERAAGAAGVMMLPIPRAGTLRSYSGVAAAEALPLIESVTISMHPGSRVVPLPEGGEYLGFVFSRGDTPAAVEAALRRAQALLAFEID